MISKEGEETFEGVSLFKYLGRPLERQMMTGKWSDGTYKGCDIYGADKESS